jgi:hypothetical protein
MHPDIMLELAKQQQQELQREVECYRLVRRTRPHTTRWRPLLLAAFGGILGGWALRPIPFPSSQPTSDLCLAAYARSPTQTGP